MFLFFFFEGEVDQKDVSTSEIIEAPKGFYVETVVTYREDFVPITDKILSYLKSWTGGPGPKSWLTTEFWKPGL